MHAVPIEEPIADVVISFDFFGCVQFPVFIQAADIQDVCVFQPDEVSVEEDCHSAPTSDEGESA